MPGKELRQKDSFRDPQRRDGLLPLDLRHRAHFLHDEALAGQERILHAT